MQRIRKVANRTEARNIHRGHVPQPENHDRRQLTDGMQNVRKFLRCAEQERSVNAVKQSPLFFRLGKFNFGSSRRIDLPRRCAYDSAPFSPLQFVGGSMFHALEPRQGLPRLSSPVDRDG